jgi:glycosyltransferase involved in cell wall biosynthesis
MGDVAVAPKLSTTEGAGKIGNYMAMALPVVTYDTAVSREYLGDLGVYAERGNSRDLAEKLRLTLDNLPHYRQVGAQLRRECITRLSWDEAIARIEAVYEQARLRRRTKDERRMTEADAPDALTRQPTLNPSTEELP